MTVESARWIALGLSRPRALLTVWVAVRLTIPTSVALPRKGAARPWQGTGCAAA